MKLKGKLTISCTRDYPVRIEVKDEDSSITFLQLDVSHQMFVAALGSLACVECELDVRGLDFVGKKLMLKDFQFELPNHKWNKRREVAVETAKKLCPKGWEIKDLTFSSQNSFFEKDGKQFARIFIRKYV